MEIKEETEVLKSPLVENLRESPLMKVDLTWRGMSVWTRDKKNDGKIFQNKGSERKLILNNVSGAVKSGSLVAVMGPSGSGKTTLLCALANRTTDEIRGDIRINGWPIDGEMRKLSAFIPQDILFIESLTTKEHLHFMVGLRFHFLSVQKRNERVDDLLCELGLKCCENTRIALLSGGERKRLVFASEIVTDPPLLFCDEISTGLDSHSTQKLISILQQLAFKGRTVICVIHQPSSQVFSAFNDLILLANGRIAFAGNSYDASCFFSSLGYHCPLEYNPSDFYIQLLSSKYDEDMPEQDFKIEEICENFAISPEAQKLSRIIGNMNEITFLTSYPEQIENTLRQINLEKASWRVQFSWLFWRSILDSIRNPWIHAIRTIHKIITALLIALCFAQIKINQKGIQDIEGALFTFLTENNFPSCYAILNVFPSEIRLFLREQTSDLYRTDVYYISKILSLIPGFIIEPFIFIIIAYWIIDLRADIYVFGMTTLVLIMTANIACAYGCLMSAAFDSIDTSYIVMMPLNQIILVTAGLYVNLRSLPVYISWIRYVSWLSYANEALTILQWQGINHIECGKNSSICIKTGDEVISMLEFNSENLTMDFIFLFIIFIFFHFLGFLALRFRNQFNLNNYCYNKNISSVNNENNKELITC